jgi:hypothetical protein
MPFSLLSSALIASSTSMPMACATLHRMSAMSGMSLCQSVSA